MFPGLGTLHLLKEDVRAHKMGYTMLCSNLSIVSILSGDALMDPHEINPMGPANMS